MAKITANNIVSGAITSTALSSDLTTQIAAGTSANAAVANIVSLTVKSVQVADSSYNTWDDTAANTTGGYLVLTGTGFTPNCVVIIGQTNATSTSYVNTTCIRAQTQSFAASTYNVYVVDSYTGATAIKINGYTTSSFPVWGTSSTLSNQEANTSFGVSLSANSDSSITYANTTALPTGTSLLANGYFYGTVTIGTQTTYSFTVDAKDTENQDALRTFSMTVTVIPQTRLYAWGRNSIPQIGYGPWLGTNNSTDYSSPVQIGTGIDWSLISAGGTYNALAIKNNGTLWTWGLQNDNGQLGLNNTTGSINSPVQIGTLTNWSKISAGSGFSAAIKTDGTLWVWGLNNVGQLGKNTSVNASSPIQVGTDNNWQIVKCGNQNMVAIRTNGTLWAWGSWSGGVNGQPADVGTYTSRSSPTQIGTDNDWSYIDLGISIVMAIKTNGTLWGWGSNNGGSLGLNITNYKSSPTQVGSSTDWRKVSCSTQMTIATKTNNTLWAWGPNWAGQLGLNDTVNRSSPVQVGSSTDWNDIPDSANNPMTLAAIKTNGSLWMCGYNAYKQVSPDDTSNKSSPTQIGTGTNWSKVTTGGSHNWGITSN